MERRKKTYVVCKHDSVYACVRQAISWGRFWHCALVYETPHSLACLAGGSSVGGLAGGVGEGEGVGDGGWDGKVSAGSLGSGQIVSFRWSGQNSLTCKGTTAAGVRSQMDWG